MAKGISKRAYHRKERNAVKEKALMIGGVVALVSLVLIIFSFMK